MDISKSLETNLDGLEKMTIELNDSSEELSNENMTIILLNSVISLFREVKNVIQYGSGRGGLNFNTVVSSLKTRDSKLKQEKRDLGRGDKKNNGNVLFTKSRSRKKEHNGNKKWRSQSHGRFKSRMIGNKPF